MLPGQGREVRRAKQRVLHPEALLQLLRERVGRVVLGEGPDLARPRNSELWRGVLLVRVGHEVAYPWLCPPSTDLIRAMGRLRLSGQWISGYQGQV